MISDLKNFSLAVIAAAALLVWSQTASAYPVQAQFTGDPAGCDLVPTTPLTHELGEAAAGFPINEQIVASALPTNTTVCGDDGIANDWEVRMVNLSGVSYKDVFFVVDDPYGVGNWDGYVTDLTSGAATRSLRIDGTLTITGSNDNLQAESGLADEIFDPGEQWSFLVTNFMAPGAPRFDSIGFGAGSAGGPFSTASILANIVPEPTALALLALGGVAMLRRTRARQIG